jgi:hypothetical protein
VARIIRTLGEASRHGMIIRAECARCRKTADFLASDLAHVYGYGREFSSIPFRCDLCGDRPTSVLPVEHIPDERSKRYVWRPTLINKPER